MPRTFETDSISLTRPSTGLGGNGFLAAFVGGLAFGAVMKGRCKFVFEFMETEGQILVLATFLLIGAALLPEAAARIEPLAILLILVSLFAVRPAAIWLSLWRTDAAPLTKGFLGWFGPRGLATVLFALLVVGQLGALKHGDEILTIAAIAVVLSAVLHGVSAAPGARWYGGKIGIGE
jgi:NhaP-type Na+/H+ or K+/H+ antiporter